MLLYIVLLTGTPALTEAQSNGQTFPAGWTGNWKGKLDWYQGPVLRQTVPMELQIQPTDSTDQFSWRIIYGNEGKDNRPYLLLPFDKSKGHWLIDERNSIVLDQFLIGDKFCGTFTVSGNTIMNTYTRMGDSLLVEFYNVQEKAIAVTGGRDTTIPKVKSYGVRSYQRGVLYRSKP